jgi:hypothetical protein
MPSSLIERALCSLQNLESSKIFPELPVSECILKKADRHLLQPCHKKWKGSLHLTWAYTRKFGSLHIVINTNLCGIFMQLLPFALPPPSLDAPVSHVAPAALSAVEGYGRPRTSQDFVASARCPRLSCTDCSSDERFACHSHLLYVQSRRVIRNRCTPLSTCVLTYHPRRHGRRPPCGP